MKDHGGEGTNSGGGAGTGPRPPYPPSKGSHEAVTMLAARIAEVRRHNRTFGARSHNYWSSTYAAAALLRLV